MDANDLANAVAARSSVPREQVDRVLVAFQDTVLAALRRNEDVAIPGFGIWNRPIRHDDTPDFSFVVPVGPLASSPPDFLKDGSDGDVEIGRIAHYLADHPVLDDTFGTGQDPFPGLDVNVHPGVVTREEVYACATSGLRAAFSPFEIGDQIVANLRGNLGGRPA